MNTYALFLTLVAVFCFPHYTHAGPIIRTGETVSVDASQTVKGDFYGFGSKVVISGASEDDMYLGAGSVTVNAPVGHDLTVFGGSVQIHGEVGDDVRVVGGDVTLGSKVKGDVVVLGGALTVLSTASIDGDIIFYGGEFTVEGPVIGAVHGSAETARVNAEVGGDITLTIAKQFALGSNAKTMGQVTYTSVEDVVRAQDAVVTHEPRKVSVTRQSDNTPLKSVAFEFILFSFAALALFLTMRRHVRIVAHTGAVRIGLSGLIGIAVLLAMPFMSMILMVSVVGIFAGLAFLSIYIALLVVACILSPLSLGYLVQLYVRKNDTLTFTTVLLGVALWVFIGIVPVVGPFMLFAYFVITLGSLGIALYERVRT